MRPRCESRDFRISQRIPKIRTRPQSETDSDFVGLVPVTGLEPVRCRQRWILSPLRLPIPSHRHMQELLYTKSGVLARDAVQIFKAVFPWASPLFSLRTNREQPLHSKLPREGERLSRGRLSERNPENLNSFDFPGSEADTKTGLKSPDTAEVPKRSTLFPACRDNRHSIDSTL